MKMNATAEHFSQANPAGPGQDDIPSLLRRVAESVEAIGPVEVQDLILHTCARRFSILRRSHS
jgi:hypothetical protein